MSGYVPIPIALNGHFGQDSDDPMDREHEINSMEKDFDYASKGVSLSRDLSSLMDADHPVQGERWSPDGSDEDATGLTPQADKAETDYQSQAKHDRESTGRTPAPQLKKQRNEDYDLNDSPLEEGFYRLAVASGDWQPSVPAAVEDEEM
eukprot:7125888-Pyramimonas_sp.AAC.1